MASVFKALIFTNIPPGGAREPKVGRTRPRERRAARQPRRGRARAGHLQGQVAQIRDRGRDHHPSDRRHDQVGPRAEGGTQLPGCLQRWRAGLRGGRHLVLMRRLGLHYVTCMPSAGFLLLLYKFRVKVKRYVTKTNSKFHTI